MTLEHELVSYHAVVRYCERILGVALPASDASGRACAEAHARAAELTLDEVRRLIWTPGIRFASRFGVRSASNGTFAVAISQPSGVITTVYPPFAHDEHRLRILSERELRQRAKRNERRFRRRPTATVAILREATPTQEE
ncbi:hypothetical protein [Shinella pollutisoli]|uniref:DUF4258 domain-containing protein n=1 Tax=Shinella pollutisoli TaxID=2250594 RepID=A0ABV7DKV0_9HYPH|nr:hypothetical protein [Shinella pollutisoli]